MGQIFSGLWGGGGDAPPPPPPAGAGAAPPAPAAAPDLEEAAARRRAKNRLKRQRQRQRKRERRAAAEASRSDTESEAESPLPVRFAPPSALHAPTAATGDERDERPARSGAGASSDEEDGDVKDTEETAAEHGAGWRTVSRQRPTLSPSEKLRRRRRRARREAMLGLQEDQEHLRRRGRDGIADQLDAKVVIAASDPTTGHVVAAHSHRAEALHPHVRSYLQARFDAAGGGKKVDARSADGAGSDPGSCAEWHALDALHRRVMFDHQRAHGGRAMTEAQSHAALAGYRFNHPRRLAAPRTDILPCRTHCRVWAEDMISDSSDED